MTPALFALSMDTQIILGALTSASALVVYVLTSGRWVGATSQDIKHLGELLATESSERRREIADERQDRRREMEKESTERARDIARVERDQARTETMFAEIKTEIKGIDGKRHELRRELQEQQAQYWTDFTKRFDDFTDDVKGRFENFDARLRHVETSTAQSAKTINQRRGID